MSGLITDESKLVFESSEAIKVISTFDELHLKEDLLRGIYAYSTSIFYSSQVLVSSSNDVCECFMFGS